METWLSREGGRISLGILIHRTIKWGHSRTDSPLWLEESGEGEARRHGDSVAGIQKKPTSGHLPENC